MQVSFADSLVKPHFDAPQAYLKVQRDCVEFFFKFVHALFQSAALRWLTATSMVAANSSVTSM